MHLVSERASSGATRHGRFLRVHKKLKGIVGCLGQNLSKGINYNRQILTKCGGLAPRMLKC
jgi:hypothetical protein